MVYDNICVVPCVGQCSTPDTPICFVVFCTLEFAREVLITWFFTECVLPLTRCGDQVTAIVRKCDEDYGHGSPFGKVCVLVGIMKKAGSADLIEWTVLSLNDLWRNSMLGIGEVSWDQLTGYRSPGHKGTVDLLIYKRDMLIHLLDVFAAKHPFEATCVAKLRDIFGSHASYRAKVSGSPKSRFRRQSG